MGVFGNPLMEESTAKDIATMIDHAKLFGTNIFCGFAGSVDGKPLPESMPQFKKVWTELAKRAKDQGVKIVVPANCTLLEPRPFYGFPPALAT